MAGSAADIARRFRELSPVLDERGRRRFAASEARAYGFGGVSVVARVTGLARSTIARGVEEIEQKPEVETRRVRKPGGGRKLKRIADSTCWPRSQAPAELAAGDPMRTLLWTSKSLRHLSQALTAKGHSVCAMVVADCLRELGYSLQANRKT